MVDLEKVCYPRPLRHYEHKYSSSLAQAEIEVKLELQVGARLTDMVELCKMVSNWIFLLRHWNNT